MQFEKFEWECIWGSDVPDELNVSHYTYRAKVIGGWLVRHDNVLVNNGGDAYRTTGSMVFIKDITHEWDA